MSEIFFKKSPIEDALNKATEMALISDHVYEDVELGQNVGQWTVVMTSDGGQKEKGSGFFGALYRRERKEDGKSLYAVAFRGTNDVNDYVSNFAVALGGLPKQASCALDFVTEACQYEGVSADSLVVAGHSLGGYLAKIVGSALAVSSVFAFNSPNPSQKTVDFLEKIIPSGALPLNRIINVRSGFDAVAGLGKEFGLTINLNTEANHHSIVSVRKSISKFIHGYSHDIQMKDVALVSKAAKKISEHVDKSSLLVRGLKKLCDYAGASVPEADFEKRAALTTRIGSVKQSPK